MGLRALVIALWILAACEIRIANRTGGDDDVSASCGNFIVEAGEVCDDGNVDDGDTCNSTCTSDETCGNGVIDTAAGETCDNGNLLGGDGCSADCTSDETCGNAVIDVAKGETCDDGDLQGGDGCSANCQSNESCGNNVTDTATDPPEQCDDGMLGSQDCDVNCTVAECGDLTVNTLANEQCDAGPSGSSQCDSNCTTAFCGDTTINSFRNEQCDDGNSSTTDACIACKTAFCGDGFVRSGTEQCDDQNATLTDACTVNCQAAFCGDGFVRAGVEACDGGAGCNASCQFDPVTYLVTEPTQLINQAQSCDVGAINRYEFNGLPIGFQWVDNSPFQPSQVTIEWVNGITCVANTTATPDMRTTDLNGAATGTFQVALGGNCNCTPTQALSTWTLTNVGSYVRNGTNSFTMSGSTSFGFSRDLIGAYARITVFP